MRLTTFGQGLTLTPSMSLGAHPVEQIIATGQLLYRRQMLAGSGGNMSIWNASLMAKHGLLTVGQTLEEALHRHETVEQLARILADARQLGPVNRIPRAALKQLAAIRRDRDGN